MQTDGRSGSDIVATFLEGAHLVSAAISDASVGQAWGMPSVLEDQLVSSLAGHLARGGVWVVGDYLDGGTPSGPVDFDTASEYFAAFARATSPDAHQAIRDRGAAVAAVGQAELVRQLGERLEVLEARLRSLDPSQLVAVIAGRIMRVRDYLVTRIVEQVIHLDDLARSVDREPWPYPVAGQDLVIEVGMRVARQTNDRQAVLRGLYRRGFADAILPVL